MGRPAAERGTRPVKLSVALRHRFPAIAIAIEFSVESPGITVLFGPSGSGKSTVIAAAAGLLRPDKCRIALGEEVLADTGAGIWLPPERRRVGLVFQDSRLFPHMSVRNNLVFGMRRTAERQIGFDDIVELLGIRPLLARRPKTLSGGELQRVAIGRALLRQPQLLLMDEPLASLDSARKAEILPYLSRLKTMLLLPVLYVTHSLDELLQLADSVVLIEAGSMVAAGPVSAISARADLPLARRDDAGAVLACRVAAHDPARQLTALRCGSTTLWVPQSGLPEGSDVRVRIPAREIILARGGVELFADRLSLHNVLAGTVGAIAADPGHRAVLVEVALDGGSVLARVTPDAIARLALAPGAAVSALIKSMSVELLGGEPAAPAAGEPRT
jgi:molybdate transport system ATP-binding protein